MFSVIKLLCNHYLWLIQLKIQLWRSISVSFQFSCFDLLEIHFVWLFFLIFLSSNTQYCTFVLHCWIVVEDCVRDVLLYQCPLLNEEKWLIARCDIPELSCSIISTKTTWPENQNTDMGESDELNTLLEAEVRFWNAWKYGMLMIFPNAYADVRFRNANLEC